MVVKVQAHFHHNRDGIYIGEGRIPELLGVHIVGYEGRIPSLKRLLIREVISKFTVVQVQAHFHHNRDGIYIGEGRIPDLLGVHIVGYEGRIPSLKRLLIREVILISLRWLRYKHIFIIIAMVCILAREEFSSY